MFFGKGSAPTYQLNLDGLAIPWENKWKYLGVMLKSGPSFGCCVLETLSKFYRALNAVVRVEGRSEDMVMLRLLEAHCIPILTFGVEVIHVRDANDRRKMRVAYNSVFRKLFNYSYRESVTDLQHSLNRPTWEQLCQRRQEQFLHNCAYWPSDSLVKVICPN